MNSKGATGEPLGHHLKLTLVILELKTMSKKKVFSVYNGSFYANHVKGDHSFSIF